MIALYDCALIAKETRHFIVFHPLFLVYWCQNQTRYFFLPCWYRDKILEGNNGCGNSLAYSYIFNFASYHRSNSCLDTNFLFSIHLDKIIMTARKVTIYLILLVNIIRSYRIINVFIDTIRMTLYQRFVIPALCVKIYDWYQYY